MGEKEALAVPPGISVVDTQVGLIVRHRFAKSEAIYTMGFGMCVITLMTFFFKYAASRGSSNIGIVSLMFAVFALAGLYCFYGGLIKFFNTTDVLVSRLEVRVIRKPLPMYGRRVIGRDQIHWVRAKIRFNRSRSFFDVVYLDKKGQVKLLVLENFTLVQAEFIASAVRQRLGLRKPPL